MFFDPEYLSMYLNERAKKLLADVDVESQVETVLQRPDIDALILKKMEEQVATGDQGNLILWFYSTIR